MKGFKMCRDCQAEYDAPVDRRFHAQPNCCPLCGPRLAILHADGAVLDVARPIDAARGFLLEGRILAIKSIGGYHLACDALNQAAVVELRRRKDRPDKPLAVMVRDIAVADEFCRIDVRSRQLLQDPARPILLLPKKAGKVALADAVAPGVNCWGVMLAYAPLHHLLFGTGPVTSDAAEPAGLKAIVMTSANLRDEPVISDLSTLSAKLGKVFDYCLTHDRPIANRCDDTVALCAEIGSGARVRPPVVITVRRSRGYAPQPVLLDARRYDMPAILACGGEQKNTFALARDNRIYLSPHIGDLNSASGMDFFSRSLELYRRWYDFKPEIIACDLHPDYLSTRFAENLALKSHRPLVRVQHHHAHIASVVAEHGLQEPVLGIALDGTGLGTDDKIWGCELLLVRRGSFERLGHLRYLPLIGGEAAIMEPERTAAGYLIYLFGEASLAARAGLEQHRVLVSQLNLGANVVFTSSTGRLFDAVSGLLGICTRASFDGQAPAWLEAAAEARDSGTYFAQDDIAQSGSGPLVIDPSNWLRKIVDDMAGGVPAARVSRRFHTSFVAAVSECAKRLCRERGLRTVCLSGGSFVNRIILGGLFGALTAARLSVFTNSLVPVNDGGTAFGQAVVAAGAAGRRSKAKSGK
jgi:hydrogenase maturation protein HypF